MNLRYLRSFYTTVKCNSISKAAKELHLTQPGLSMQLQALENEMNAKLLDRSNKGVTLTEKGSVLFEHAQNMLALEDSILYEFHNLNSKNASLTLYSCKDLGETILPCTMYTFKEIYPNIDITMEIHNSSSIIEDMQNHKVNLGIVQTTKKSDDFIYIPILNDNLILVSGNEVDKTSISLDELKSIPIITREESSGSFEILKSSLKDKNLNIKSLNTAISLNSPESIKASVKNNRGFAFLPQLVVEGEIRSNKLKKISVEGLSIPFSYYLVYRKNYTLSKYEQKLLNYLTSKKRCFCY